MKKSICPRVPVCLHATAGLLLLISCIGAFPDGSKADDPAVPFELQAVILEKILEFDKTLAGVSPIRLVVVYNDASASAGKEAMQAFSEIGFEVERIANEDLSEGLNNAHVMYVMPGVDADVAVGKGILPISGDLAMVESGQVAMSIVEEEGKPAIVIHKGQLRASGHVFLAELQKYAKTVS